MAHLWKRTAQGWEARKLDLKLYDLDSLSGAQAGEAKPGTSGAEVAWLIPATVRGSPVWAVASSHDAHVRVNGRAPLAGLSVLCDRDEIRVRSGVQYFFSTETLAVVEEFPAQERTVYCGRCRQPIKAGSPAVRCPNCGIWYHQSTTPALPCWTYSEKCSICPHPTALDAGFSWVPEE